MRLRTEIREWCYTGTSYAAIKIGDTTEALNHDAMAAHALLQAMDESTSLQSIAMKHRAAEILAGWLGEERG